MSETDAIALVELSKRDFTNYYLKIEAYGEAIKWLQLSITMQAT